MSSAPGSRGPADDVDVVEPRTVGVELRRPRRVVRVRVPDARDVQTARARIAIGAEEVAGVEVVAVGAALGPHVPSRRCVDDEHAGAIATPEQHAASLIRIRGGSQLTDPLFSSGVDGRAAQVQRLLRPYSPVER